MAAARREFPLSLLLPALPSQIRNSSSEKRKLQEELELMSGIKLKDYEPGGLGYHSIEALVEKEVTPAVANVLQRMNIAPRSFGSISPPAHVAGAVACNIMNMLLQRENKVDNLSGKYGPYQSCGEGGEHPSRYGTVAASLDHQVASGRWGAGLNYMARAKRLGIKVSQGVKPGQGGHLPGAKNKKIIAETRGTPEGIDLISPPPHHDIYSIEDLAALIRDLRVVNPEAIISVKLTARKGIGLVAAGAAKCGANDVKVTGYGATAAATAESKFNFATGVHYGIKEAHDVLTATGMRELVTLSASGRLQTPEEVVKAFLLGADQVSFGTGPMLALGCVKVDRCHDGTCPTGIATMDPERMSQFQGKPEHVARWMIQMAKEVEAIVATYGGSIDELIGRRDLLKVVPDGVYTNLEQMLEMPLAPTTGFPVEPKVDPVSYQELSAITQVRAGKRSVIVNNTQTDRTLGGRLAALSISDPNIKEALDEGVQMIGNGVGGSSLGFCAPAGLSIVVPRANHFVGKSLDGGEILVNGVAGDSLFYGGQAGFGFVRGAKHRFGVRSCCDLVAEMVGPMAACYRTGGHMMVLGSPACYDVSGNPLDVPSYSPPYRMPDPHSPASLDEIVGPGIGGGMTGGKLVLPTMLEERIRERDFFAEGANTMIQIPLSKDPAAEKWIVEALTRIETSLSAKSPAGKQLATQATTVDHSDPEVSVVAALLKLYRTDRAAFQKQFTVLDATKRTNPNEAVIAADFVAWNAETSQPVGPLIPLVTSAGPHANLEHSDDIAAVGSNVAPSDMPGRKKKKKRGAAAMNADGLGLKTAAEIADSPPGVFKDMMPTKDIGACGLYALAAKDNIATHHLVSDAIHALDCLAHRNGHTRDPKTHDGFGIAFHGGHSFWEKAFPEHTLAEDGYVVMPVFMPPTKPTQMGPMASVPEDAAGQYSRAKDRLNGILDNFGFSIAGTREVPIAYENLGMIAQEGMMPIEQFLIQCPEGTDFSRFCIDLERVAAQFDLASGFDGSFTHVPHVLSASPWVVYKGFTPPSDFASVFQDMSDPNFVTNAACGHGRFATNSEPTLQSVQPTRAFVHNGEVNNVALLDIAMADKHFLDYLGGNQTVELKLKKAGRAAMDLSDSYKCGLWHGYRRWAAAEDETAADLTLVKQMMGVVPAKNAQGGFGWRALTNIQEAFLETGPSARINMGMPGQPELIAAATDANHFRPLEALEDDKCVHFSSEYIDKVMPLNGTPWTFGGEGVLAMTKADMTLSEGVLPSLTDPETIALVKKLTPPPPVTKDSAPINRHSDEEIDTLKAVVGWSSDTEHMMDNMVGKGVLTLESMGYAAPTNPGMPGFRLDLGGLIKSSFAQVTSPPLAYHEEGKHYMSQLAVIGPHVLTSPVLSDAGVQSLISSTDMGVHTVDTTFAVNMHDLELEKEIRAVVDGACDLVRASVAASDGLNKPAHQMLLLSDLTLSRARGPLPQIFVASLLDKQLREAGLRKHTSLVCQSVTTLLPRDLAQLVAMGADAVHPVLPLDPRSTKHIEEGSLLPDQRTENVLATFRKGLNLFMASVGVSHFKAYQACRHLWYAEGLDANVAKMLGVDTIFTGIDFERLSRIVQVNHNFPREKGLEKYRPGAQKTFWPTWYVRAHIDAARGEDAPGQLQAANAKLAYLKRTEPDGELRLVKSRVWNAQNPFHILLVGAGPAAYELLKQLEARGIPCIPHLVEQRPISTGLVLGAISPLHDGTKQGVVRQYIQMLESGNIQFYGECAITKKNLANVAPMISAIVDCTGAMGSENSVPMYEDLAVPTSAMIRAYVILHSCAVALPLPT